MSDWRTAPSGSVFIIDDDSVDLPNVTPLVFAEEQGSYLVGIAAGLKTKTDKVGPEQLMAQLLAVTALIEAGAGVHVVELVNPMSETQSILRPD